MLYGCVITKQIQPTENRINPSNEAVTYTYDGEFDPYIFPTWEFMDEWICQHGDYHFVAKNPNPDSNIHYVEVENTTNEYGNYVIIGYWYTNVKSGIQYVFKYYEPKNRFIQVNPATGNL